MLYYVHHYEKEDFLNKKISDYIDMVQQLKHLHFANAKWKQI